jgi:hypothetical protein
MPKRRCFISAAYGERLDALQRVLNRLGLTGESATSGTPHRTVLFTVAAAIKKAEFVIGVFHDLAPRSNVVLELGIAVGLNKPMLLLTSGANVHLFDLSSYPHFTTDLQDEDILYLQLDAFLRSLRRHHCGKAFRAQGAIRDESFETALEQSVATAILRAGGRVTVPSCNGQSGIVDLLMWLPHQDKHLFNPAAVRVRSRVDPDELPALQRKLAEFVRSSGLGCGPIVVDSVNLEGERRRLPPVPSIYVIGFQEMTSKLENSELASWLDRC